MSGGLKRTILEPTRRRSPSSARSTAGARRRFGLVETPEQQSESRSVGRAAVIATPSSACSCIGPHVPGRVGAGLLEVTSAPASRPRPAAEQAAGGGSGSKPGHLLRADRPQALRPARGVAPESTGTICAGRAAPDTSGPRRNQGFLVRQRQPRAGNPAPPSVGSSRDAPTGVTLSTTSTRFVSAAEHASRVAARRAGARATSPRDRHRPDRSPRQRARRSRRAGALAAQGCHTRGDRPPRNGRGWRR